MTFSLNGSMMGSISMNPSHYEGSFFKPRPHHNRTLVTLKSLFDRNSNDVNMTSMDVGGGNGGPGPGPTELPPGEEMDDNEHLIDLANPDVLIEKDRNKNYREQTQAWWNVGDFLENSKQMGGSKTHQSVGLSLTGSRVFANQKDEIWDLSDSLAELYETVQKQEDIMTGRRHRVQDSKVDEQSWLAQNSDNGFLRVSPPVVGRSVTSSKVVTVTKSTTAHHVCLKLGIAFNSLHIQLNGDIIRRLDPDECPLVLQNEYLAGLGFRDHRRIQEEGQKEELGYLIKFYSGKPAFDGTYSRNQLTAFIDIKKGKVLHQWTKRLCVISGTRLLIYKDKSKRSKPTTVQLAKGSVEEVRFKGHEFSLKLTSTLQGEKFIFLSFPEKPMYIKWFKKCKKATSKLPTSADLSNCHLEYLPETIFINDQLSMLNLRHNALKERPLDDDVYTIGWIDDLPRFTCLRSLNLADNNMSTFPNALCDIRTLVELNISSNKIEEIPSEIAFLINLQALHIHNNHLHSLPDELVRLRKLFILVLAFNRFTVVPPVVAQLTDVRTSEVENIIMAGNRIGHLSNDTLSRMKYVKKIDFRMNMLTLSPSETSGFNQLEHLTHLDVRDNRIRELDIRPLKTVEYLNCERCGMLCLQLNGAALKNLFAADNNLDILSVHPKPEWLLQIDVTRNQLMRLPDWLPDCFFLQKIYAGHNELTELPSRIFKDSKKLKSLRVNHNNLATLPEDIGNHVIEELHLQNNCLTKLPKQFLQKSNKLRILNLTKNRLTSLPPLNDSPDLNKIQEFYLTGNCLGDSALGVIASYPRLKVLHLADNEIYEVKGSDLSRMEMLQEFNVSGNSLRTLPDAIGQLSKLVVIRAHSNLLQSIPDLRGATSLKVLDVGHNRLLNVSVTTLMNSQINLLDMSLNSQLKVDPKEFRNVKNRKSVCLVDLTGQNRKLPGLGKNKKPSFGDEELDPSTPWKVGLSETSGVRNKLCVATLRIHKFHTDDEAMIAMFDGGQNNEVPRILSEKMPEILKNEIDKDSGNGDYMKMSMLSAHRMLKIPGQRLGASAVVGHISRVSTNQMNQYKLQLANVGDVEAVLCRKGEAVVLTQKFLVEENREECERIYKADGIITEDGRVNGSSAETRLLGCAFLYPHVLPEPYTSSIALCHDDEFIIIGNKGLWKFVDYAEAVEAIYETGNPVVAAKQLQDLAQGYGSRENVAVLVVRFNTDTRPSLWRLRTRPKSMSIDDFEAARQHEESQKIASNSKPQVVSGKDDTDSHSNRDENKENRNGSSQTLRSQDMSYVESMGSDYIKQTVDAEASPKASPKALKKLPRGKSPKRTAALPPPSDEASPPPLRPLPKQRFRKKDAANAWEGILQKRLTEDVKEKELRSTMVEVGMSSQESMFSQDARPMSVVEIPLGEKEKMKNEKRQSHGGNWQSLHKTSGKQIAAALRQQETDEVVATKTEKSNTLRGRVVTPPWVTDEQKHSTVGAANPAYSYTGKEPNETQIINMTEQQKRPRVRSRIALFENFQKESSPKDEGKRGPPPQRTLTLEKLDHSPMLSLPPEKKSQVIRAPPQTVPTFQQRPQKGSDETLTPETTADMTIPSNESNYAEITDSALCSSEASIEPMYSTVSMNGRSPSLGSNPNSVHSSETGISQSSVEDLPIYAQVQKTRRTGVVTGPSSSNSSLGTSDDTPPPVPVAINIEEEERIIETVRL